MVTLIPTGITQAQIEEARRREEERKRAPTAPVPAFGITGVTEVMAPMPQRAAPVERAPAVTGPPPPYTPPAVVTGPVIVAVQELGKPAEPPAFEPTVAGRDPIESAQRAVANVEKYAEVAKFWEAAAISAPEKYPQYERAFAAYEEAYSRAQRLTPLAEEYAAGQRRIALAEERLAKKQRISAAPPELLDPISVKLAEQARKIRESAGPGILVPVMPIGGYVPPGTPIQALVTTRKDIREGIGVTAEFGASIVGIPESIMMGVAGIFEPEKMARYKPALTPITAITEPEYRKYTGALVAAPMGIAIEAALLTPVIKPVITGAKVGLQAVGYTIPKAALLKFAPTKVGIQIAQTELKLSAAKAGAISWTARQALKVQPWKKAVRVDIAEWATDPKLSIYQYAPKESFGKRAETLLMRDVFKPTGKIIGQAKISRAETMALLRPKETITYTKISLPTETRFFKLARDYQVGLKTDIGMAIKKGKLTTILEREVKGIEPKLAIFPRGFRETAYRTPAKAIETAKQEWLVLPKVYGEFYRRPEALASVEVARKAAKAGIDATKGIATATADVKARVLVPWVEVDTVVATKYAPGAFLKRTVAVEAVYGKIPPPVGGGAIPGAPAVFQPAAAIPEKLIKDISKFMVPSKLDVPQRIEKVYAFRPAIDVSRVVTPAVSAAAAAIPKRKELITPVSRAVALPEKITIITPARIQRYAPAVAPAIAQRVTPAAAVKIAPAITQASQQAIRVTTTKTTVPRPPVPITRITRVTRPPIIPISERKPVRPVFRAITPAAAGVYRVRRFRVEDLLKKIRRRT